LPFIGNPLALIFIDRLHFGGVVFPMPPCNELIAKYHRQTQKTLNKAIKIKISVVLPTNTHYSTGTIAPAKCRISPLLL